MDRAARAKKPNKAASALESLRAIKAGEAKAIDNYGIEDEDVVFEDDDADDNEYEELEPAEQCPKKRKQDSEENKARKKRAAGNLARMQQMFASAPAKQKSQSVDAVGDGLLDQLLNELDDPGAARKAKPSRSAAAPKPARAPKAARRAYDPSSVLQQQPDAPMDMHEDIPEAPQATEDACANVPDHPMTTDSKIEDAALPKDLPDTLVAASTPDDKPAESRAVEIPKDVLEMPMACADDDAEADMQDVEEEGVEEPEADAQQTDSGDALNFFFLDALYEPAMVGMVLLIGKVQPKRGGEYVTACVRVKDMKQCLYVIPKPFVFQDTEGDIQRLHGEVKEGTASKGKLLKLLHGRCTELKKEIRERLGTDSITIKPVMRKYAFEDERVPAGPQWVLKVSCNVAPGAIRADLSGRNFSAVLGTLQTPLEALQLKRKLMGPCWLSLKNATEETSNKLSWCKMEYTVHGHKSVTPLEKQPPTPPLRVVSMNIKTVPDSTDKAQEIVAVSVLHTTMRMDHPMDVQSWKTANSIKRLTVITPPHGTIVPGGLQNRIKAENDRMSKSNGGDAVRLEASERGLLSYLLVRWQILDADLIIGHNIGPWDLTILLQRLQHHKLPDFSRVGRLRRNRVPNLSGGGGMYGGGASHGVLQCFSGRLLLDTYVQARDLLKEVEYSLSTLSSKLLNQHRHELAPHQVRHMFENMDDSIKLVRNAESDAWLSMGLAVYLQAIPLTLQLSNLSGFLWSRTLQGNRAQRIEMLLLHEFHARKFLLPDKAKREAGTGKDSKKVSGKTAAKASAGGQEEDGEEGKDEGNPSKTTNAAAAKSKGPQYAGGLVLEPKKGIYNKFVLLLDFNSLYPSIIQEYNICFTTVQRPKDDSMPDLPASGRSLAPLPVVIQGLVQKRRAVKSSMKNCSDPVKLQQLDIRQQAIKLTANSMYGCLGFTASRFYAKPLAQLITCQGRDILQRTVDLVQGSLNLEVIYGDTDSIMIATKSNSMEEVLQLGEEAKRAINKHYRLLEIDIDGVFKSMLLLKKKKYAAVKMVPAPQGGFTEVLESKGIDIVRRDWSLISREVGQKVLQEVLSGREQEDIVEVVHELLRTVAEQLKAGAINTKKFLISKQLTKQPEDYPDARTQAHVQVALRMKAKGQRDGTRAGNVVQYIICTDQNADPAAGSSGLAARAYHPSELQENQNLSVDTEYYLSQQLHPVVARICAPLELTSDARLAECLGLDPTKFKKSVPVAQKLAASDPFAGAKSVLDDDDRFCDLQPLALVDDKGAAVPLPDLSSGVSWETCVSSAEAGFSRMDAAHLSNQAVLATRSVIKNYYDGKLRTEESGAGVVRDITLAPEHPTLGPCAPGACPLASGAMSTMEPALPEAQAYMQMTYVARQLDVARVQDQVPSEASAKQQLAKLLQLASTAVSAVNRLAHSARYHWVNLSSFSSLFQALEVS